MPSWLRSLEPLLNQPAALVAVEVLLFALVVATRFRKMCLLVLRSLRRNLLRTVLTSVATFVMVLVVTLVWTVLHFLNRVTEEKKEDLKAIVTERWQIPSQMPYAYA